MGMIKIGKIFNTRGLKGELKVKPLTDFVDDRFIKGGKCFVNYNNEYVEVEIERKYDYKNGNIIVVFKNLNDINLVEKYKNCFIYIDEKNRHELDDGEYYASDLIGLTIINQNDEKIGEVVEVLETGANSVLRIDSGALLPYVDKFIIEINLSKKIIKMNILEGLL